MHASRLRARSALWFAATCSLAVGLLAAANPAQAAGKESWDAAYMAGSKIGFIHTFVEPVKSDGKDLLRVRIDIELHFRRGNDVTTNTLRYGTIETLDGAVLRLDTRTLTSEGELRVHGDVKDGEMELTITAAGGAPQSQVIKWGPDVRGPYATEMSLSREPMKPGERRELKMFVPDLNKICDTTLTAKQFDDVVLGDGSKRSLLRVEETVMLDGKRMPFDATRWVDSDGQVIKTTQDLMGGMVYYRTTKEAARAPSRKKEDRIQQSVIKVAKRIANSTRTRAIRYRVELRGVDLTEVLPNDRRQTLTAEGESKSSGVLEVKMAGPEAGTADSAELDPKYSRSNVLVSSDDSEVQKLARRAVGDATGDWAKAVNIERWVHQNLKDKNFETTFAPASEVARNLSGDCTEHAVLAAAMSRAIGIPARVAIGLVYAENLGGFGFHMWHEVHVNGRWVALDSAFDESDVDATHIKLSDSSLDGVAPFEAFLLVARVMGKLSIVPVEVR